MITSIAELLRTDLEREADGSRRTLERVPEGRNEWKPHEKSMTLGYLAALVATMPLWASAMIREEELDLAAPGRLQTSSFGTNRELLDGYEEAIKEARAALAKTTDAHLKTTWRLLYDGDIVSEQPRHIAIRDGVLNHWIHHRGQLTVYLRLNEVPVPALYGPSADEGGL